MRLREVRRQIGDPDRDDVAKKLGVSKSALASYERGQTEPAASALGAYRDHFGVNPIWIISGEGNVFGDPSKIPAPAVKVDQTTILRLVDTLEEVAEATVRRQRVPSPRTQPRPPKTLKFFPDHYVSAGGGNTSPYETTGEEIETLEELADRILDMRLDDMRVFRILGDSMFPTFASGDVVIANARHQEITEDTLYIVSIDGEMLVKRAQWGDDGALTWASDNPDSRYRPIRLEGDEINAAVVVGQVERMIIALPKRV